MKRLTIASKNLLGLVGGAVWGDFCNIRFLISDIVVVHEHVTSSSDLHVAHLGLQVSRRVLVRPRIQSLAVENTAYRIHVVAEWRLGALGGKLREVGKIYSCWLAQGSTDIPVSPADRQKAGPAE